MDQKQMVQIEKDCIDNRLHAYQIKARVLNGNGYFEHANMKASKINMKSFHVHKTDKLGIYHIFADGYGGNKLERWFNAFDNMFYYEYDLAVRG